MKKEAIKNMVKKISLTLLKKEALRADTYQYDFAAKDFDVILLNLQCELENRSRSANKYRPTRNENDVFASC